MGLNTKPKKQGYLEREGARYLNRLIQKNAANLPSEPQFSDAEITRRINRASLIGSSAALAIGALTTAVSVYVDVYFENEDWFTHYSWLIAVTILMCLIEFLVLSSVSLQTVFQVTRIVGYRDFDLSSRYEVIDAMPNILARAALEISDPVYKFLNIDPLARVSKRYLLLIAFLYKSKILLSNFIVKIALRQLIGKTLFRVSVAYVAAPITGIWNAIVMFKVVREARLRIAGAIIAHHIAENYLNEVTLSKLSLMARMAALRAVACCAALTQQYHPNMIILLVKLYDTLKIQPDIELHDWDRFIEALKHCNEKERLFVLDLLSVAAAFDGKISNMEKRYLQEAFYEFTPTYYSRMEKLTRLLIRGSVNQAKKLSVLDFNL